MNNACCEVCFNATCTDVCVEPSLKRKQGCSGGCHCAAFTKFSKKAQAERTKTMGRPPVNPNLVAAVTLRDLECEMRSHEFEIKKAVEQLTARVSSMSAMLKTDRLCCFLQKAVKTKTTEALLLDAVYGIIETPALRLIEEELEKRGIDFGLVCESIDQIIKAVAGAK